MYEIVRQAIDTFQLCNVEKINDANNKLLDFTRLPPLEQCPVIAQMMQCKDLNVARYGWFFLKRIVMDITRNDSYEAEIEQFLFDHYGDYLLDEEITLVKADTMVLHFSRSKEKFAKFCKVMTGSSQDNSLFASLELIIWRSYLLNKFEIDTKAAKKELKAIILNVIMPRVNDLSCRLLSRSLNENDSYYKQFITSLNVYVSALSQTMPSNQGNEQIRALFDVLINNVTEYTLKVPTEPDLICHCLRALITLYKLRHVNIKEVLCSDTAIKQTFTVWKTIEIGVQCNIPELIEVGYDTISAITDIIVTIWDKRTFDDDDDLIEDWITEFETTAKTDQCLLMEIKCLKKMGEFTPLTVPLLVKRLMACFFVDFADGSCSFINPATVNISETENWETFIDAFRFGVLSDRSGQLMKQLLKWILSLQSWPRTNIIIEEQFVDQLISIEKLYKVVLNNGNSTDRCWLMGMSFKLTTLVKLIFTKWSGLDQDSQQGLLYSKLLAFVIRVKLYFACTGSDFYNGDVFEDIDLYFCVLSRTKNENMVLMTSLGYVISHIFKKRILAFPRGDSDKCCKMIEQLSRNCERFPVSKRMPLIEAIIVMSQRESFDEHFITPLARKVLEFELGESLEQMMSADLKFHLSNCTGGSNKRKNLQEWLIIIRLLSQHTSFTADMREPVSNIVMKTVHLYNNWRSFECLHKEYKTGLTKAEQSIIDTENVEQSPPTSGDQNPNTFFESVGDFLFVFLDDSPDFTNQIEFDWDVFVEKCLPNVTKMGLGARRWFLKGYRAVIPKVETEPFHIFEAVILNFFQNGDVLMNQINEILSRKNECEVDFTEEMSCAKRLLSDHVSCAVRVFGRLTDGDRPNLALSKTLTNLKLRSKLFGYFVRVLELNDSDLRKEISKTLCLIGSFGKNLVEFGQPEYRNNAIYCESDAVSVLLDFGTVVFSFAKSFLNDSDDLHLIKKVLSPYLHCLSYHTDPTPFANQFNKISTEFGKIKFHFEKIDDWLGKISVLIDKLANINDDPNVMEID